MLYIHILHSLPRKRTILTVGCPTRESVVFAWLKSHHWLMPEFSQLNVCFSLGVSKGNIDDGLLACTPWILDALGAFAGCCFQQCKTLSHLSILGPRTPMCVWLRRGPLCQAFSWEMKREKGSSPSLHLTPVPYPQANKKQWYFVITFRLFLSICSFVYSFNEYLGGLACGAHEKSTETLERGALASCESCLRFISGAPEQMWKLRAGGCSHSLTLGPSSEVFRGKRSLRPKDFRFSHTPSSIWGWPSTPQHALALSCASTDQDFLGWHM